MDMVQNMVVRDRMAIPVFAKQLLQCCPADFPRRFVEKAFYVFHDRCTTAEVACNTYCVFVMLVITSAETFLSFSLIEATNLIPAFIIGFQRQTCGQPSDMVRNFRTTLRFLA